MKSLKELTRKERTLISCGCDTFFLTINKTKSLKPIFTYLKSVTMFPSRYDKEIWMIVTAVGKCLRSGAVGTQIPLASDKYTVANNVHGLKLNNKRVSQVLDKLDEVGELAVYKGYRDFRYDVSITTCVIPSDTVKSLYTEKVLKNIKSNIERTEMVEIKDSKTKIPFMKLTKFKGVNVHRDLMFDYNKLLNRNVIMVAGNKCFVNYKQVFADDLDGAGRVYSFGGFQTTPSYLRDTITINGNLTTECDIKGMHCMSLYCLEGIVVEDGFDPYTIDDTVLNISPKQSRKFCKMAVMCMINCKSKHGASKALYNIWKADNKEVKDDQDFPDLVDCSVELCKKVVTEIQYVNEELDFFPKGVVMWKKLQRLDSMIMEHIIQDFINKGAVCLGWHDSVICEAVHQEFLISSIKKSWFKVFGTYANCYIDIEF